MTQAEWESLPQEGVPGYPPAPAGYRLLVHDAGVVLVKLLFKGDRVAPVAIPAEDCLVDGAWNANHYTLLERYTQRRLDRTP